MTRNSQLSTNEPKKSERKSTKTKTTNNQNRNRIREMDITWRVFSGGREEQGGKGTGIRNRIDRHKIDRGQLRILQEMEKPKNLHV